MAALRHRRRVARFAGPGLLVLFIDIYRFCLLLVGLATQASEFRRARRSAGDPLGWRPRLWSGEPCRRFATIGRSGPHRAVPGD